MKSASPKPTQERGRTGSRSPLDRLPQPVQRELLERCQGTEPFREICAWLRRDHRCQTSPNSLRRWLQRQSDPSRKIPNSPMRFANRRTKQRAPQSPLYTLPAAVAAKLAAKCDGPETLDQIRTWLIQKHGITTSLTALSVWWAKHCAAEAQSLTTGAMLPGSLGAVEITVHAPGAERVCIRLVPLEKARP